MKQKFYLLISTIFLLFLLLEVSLTFIVTEDLDGNLSLNYIHLKPFQIPIIETEKKIETLISDKLPDSLLVNYKSKNFTRKYFNIRLIPDSLLGWAPNPIFKSSDGLYVYNRNGIRTRNILDEIPPKNKLRIAIFGDSYSHGDEVAFENTIGNYLEELLNQSKINAEVINFAISGYGIDQAFLRWKLIDEQFNPDIVILGVQFENAKRNINLLRPFYYFTTEIPYSKPRFLLEGNALQFLPNPILDIKNTVDIIKNFDSWQYSHFEGFYSNQNYHPNFLFYSKTFSLFSSTISQLVGEINYYKSSSESFKVTYKLFEKFQKDVKDKGEVFIPVHLPVKNDFDFLSQKFLSIVYNQQFIYDELFDALRKKANFVETYDTLENWGKTKDMNQLFMKRHYSPTANKVIANQIFEFIQNEHPQILFNSKRKN